MKEPSNKILDIVRKKGLRPQVVACVIHNRKILFLYNKEHKIWGFVQGGVDNKERPYRATLREVAEELGESFAKNCRVSPLGVFGQNEIEFPKKLHGSKELHTDKGEEVKLIGKKYFYVLINSKSKYIKLRKSEFDKYKWLTYDEAYKLIKSIYQKGKKAMSAEILDLLFEHDIIS